MIIFGLLFWMAFQVFKRVPFLCLALTAGYYSMDPTLPARGVLWIYMVFFCLLQGLMFYGQVRWRVRRQAREQLSVEEQIDVLRAQGGRR